jgi:hypothetical protein
VKQRRQHRRRRFHGVAQARDHGVEERRRAVGLDAAEALVEAGIGDRLECHSRGEIGHEVRSVRIGGFDAIHELGASLEEAGEILLHRARAEVRQEDSMRDVPDLLVVVGGE